jgi:pimeloyl-ACP methyl ester carboxylesterase
MNAPALRTVTCAHPGGLHRLAYWEWGEPSNGDVLVCVHGLTRNGRDFDALAQSLAGRFRIVCPDMPGRGRSEWLRDPNLYAVPQYVADCVTLAARLDVERLTWLGTSMGGLIGMLYAAMPGNAIDRLILNDVGPEIDPAGLARIAGYVGQNPSYASFEEGERALKQLMVDFGPLDDAQFRLLSQHFLVQRDGGWRYDYDPAIATPIRNAPPGPPPDLWPLFQAIRCPVRVLRGQRSDILTRPTADRMTTVGADVEVIDIAGVGHAPTLIPDDQIAIVERFLNRS